MYSTHNEVKSIIAERFALNARINVVEGKIPNITNLARTTALKAVENKIANVSSLVKQN